MDYTLFLLLNLVLFIRPAEIIPELDRLPIYNVVMLANLAVSGIRIPSRLTPESLRNDPISFAVVGLLAAVFLSHASHMILDRAQTGFSDFSKVVLYYFLLTVTLNTTQRLWNFLAWLVLFVIILTTLSLLHYHGIVDIPSLAAVADNEVDPETGEPLVVMRLCSTGIFNDPNDLCLILLSGMIGCLAAASNKSRGLFRLVWLAPIGLFGYALMLTHSRGGFLAMLGAVGVMAQSRFGWRRALPVLALVIPVFLVLFAGRQTNISTSGDTGQDRIQLWSEGLTMLRQAPLFGSGWNTYQERAGLVAHNSFVHGFAEMGFFGGSLFLGAFAYSVDTLGRLKRREREIADPDLRRLRLFLMTMVAGYFFGTLTISRNYVIPTYLVLGLASSYLRLVICDNPGLQPNPVLPVGQTLIVRWSGYTLAFLIATYFFIRTFARWGG